MKETPLCVYCGLGECNQQLDSNYYHEACFRSAIQKGIDCACPKCEGKRKAEVKETPILFSSPMVKAILEGRKYQTRRVIKGKGKLAVIQQSCGPMVLEDYDDVNNSGIAIKCPYGKPGDLLWVRETFLDNALSGYAPVFFYRADSDEKPEDRKWTPSIFMPKAASRITLEVTGVRVERLNAIRCDDARAEGVEEAPSMVHLGQRIWRNYHRDDEVNWFSTPIGSFRSLWDSINGKRDGGIYAWDRSPWVWVISFKKL